MKSFSQFLVEEGGIGDHELEVNLHNEKGWRLTRVVKVRGKMRHEPEAKEHVRAVEKDTNEHPEHGKHGPWTATDYRWQS